MDYDGLMDSRTFIMLYKALVRPHVEYANSIIIIIIIKEQIKVT